MPTPLPHHYEAVLSWPGTGAATMTGGPRPPIVGGAPREFDGHDGWWSPEHLLISALNLCLMTTFEALARKRRLVVDSYQSRGHATLDKAEGNLGFTLFTLEVDVVCAPADVDRVHDTLLLAKRHCLVANTLALPVHVEVSVTAPQPAAVGA